MKTTLLLSLLVHGLFFSVALMLSALLIQGSRPVPGERVITVDLAEERGNKEMQPAPPRQEYRERARVQASLKKPVPLARKVEQAPPAGADDSIRKQEEGMMPVQEPVRSEGSGAGDLTAAEDTGPSEIEVDDPAAEYQDAGNTVAAFVGPQNAGAKDGTGREGRHADILAVIAGAIERAKTYPLIARRRGLEGTVHVRFLINPRGEPQDIVILKSSGHGILDAATVRVVRRAAPYPRVDRRVEVPVAYRLKD